MTGDETFDTIMNIENAVCIPQEKSDQCRYSWQVLLQTNHTLTIHIMINSNIQKNIRVYAYTRNI